MILFFFSQNSREAGERLLNIIQRELNGQRIEVNRTVECFLDRFHHPILESVIAIIMIDDRKMLEELILAQSLMDDVPILLVLPDGKVDTFSNGLKLYPRFVTDVESDFSDLVSVLNKLMHRILKNASIEMNEKMKPPAVPSCSQEIG